MTVNEAYRALRDDLTRGAALLRLRGREIKEQGGAAEPEWRGRRAAHEARVAVWLAPHQARTARGERIVHVTIGGRTTAFAPSRQR